MGKRGPKKEVIRKALTDAHLLAIGRVAANWSYLEMQLRFEITTLAGLTSDVGFAMLAPLGFPQWLELVDFFLVRSPALFAREGEWKKLRKEINDLRVERNDVVHAFWRVPQPTGLIDSVMTGSPRRVAKGVNVSKGILKEMKKLERTPAEIRDLAKRIRRAYLDLAKLLDPTVPAPAAGAL